MSDTAGCEYSLSLGKFLNSSSLSFLDYKIVSNNNFLSCGPHEDIVPYWHWEGAIYMIAVPV